MPASPASNAVFSKNEAAPKLGRYELGRRLASGGAGSVYLARLIGINDFERFFAIKCIHEYLRDEPGFVEMFLEEARLAARLSHPNVVQVYELAQDGDVLFMAMEYLHGESLATLLRNANEAGIRIGYDLAAWIMANTADGLHHAHQVKDTRGNPVGLVHRDVSPQNILVTYEGVVKLIDFGIARAEGRVVKTQQGKIKGKLMYMAPEQALGSDVDHRADQFALGATLFELSTGTRLFPGSDGAEVMRKVIAAEIALPSAVCPDYPKELEQIVLRTLQRDRKRRFESSAALARELHLFAAQAGHGDFNERLTELVTKLCAETRLSREQAIAELKQRGENEVRETTRADSVPKAGPDSGERTDVDVEPTVLDSPDALHNQPTELVTAAIGPKQAGAPRAKVEPPKSKVEVAAAALQDTEIEPPRASLTDLGDKKPGATSRTKAVLAATAVVLFALVVLLGWRYVSGATVALDITLAPAVQGTISVAGTKYSASAAQVTVPKTHEQLYIDVEANGFSPARVAVVPDQDRKVEVRLVPLTALVTEPVEEPAALAPAASLAPAEPSTPPATSAAGVTKPPATMVQRPAKPSHSGTKPAGGKPKSDVIDKNPF